HAGRDLDAALANHPTSKHSSSGSIIHHARRPGGASRTRMTSMSYTSGQTISRRQDQHMRAIVYERHGGPEVLEAKDVPDPTPAEGQVLVDVEAVGVNYRDVYERTGAEADSTPPGIIGVEGAGT